MRYRPTPCGYCAECGYEGPLSVVDEGIGPYEYWGFRGYHHDYQTICPECESYNVVEEGVYDDY